MSFLSQRESWCSASKRYRDRHPDRVSARNKVTNTQYSQKKFLARRAIKAEVLAHYSGSSVAKCITCGHSDIRALTLDHIQDDGAEQRRTNGRLGGFMFYRQLQQRGYPSGYQTLCANCNLVKELVRREKVVTCRF